MKSRRSVVYPVSALAFGAIVLCVHYVHIWLCSRSFQSFTLHSAVEAIGATIAVLIAGVLFQISSQKGEEKFFLPAVGFLGMGVFDFFHAVVLPGQGFVLLHTMSRLVGGLFFSLAWFPVSAEQSRLRRWFAGLTLTGIVLFSLWVIFFREAFPKMVQGGQFTLASIGINFMGGLLFAAATIRFLLEFNRYGKWQDYTFMWMASLFSLSGILFRYSEIWCYDWWLWHLLSLSAYSIAGIFVVCQYFGLLADLKKSLSGQVLSAEKLAKLNNELEIRVVERTKKLESANEALKKEIDRRKQVEEEIERFFTLSFDLFCIAGFDGYFTRINPAFSKTLGWTEGELLKKPFLEFVHPQDKEKTTAEVEKLFSTGQSTIQFENRYLCKDGSYKWLCWTSRPSQGKMYAVARDVTEQKKFMEVLEHAKQVADAASQAKSEFLANMSHELRTPLNAIIGFSEVLYDESFGHLNEKQKDYIKDVLESGRHLLLLINDILDLSKIEAGKMELSLSSFSLKHLLQESTILIKEKALKHNIGVSTVVGADVEEMRADHRKIKQIVFNLLSNAVKFTPDGGKVGISAKKIDDSYEVTIWDTGIGISGENQGRLFKEFSQIQNMYSRAQSGTGLGLALSKKFVELHGGRIWVESEGKDKGSAFKFILPVKCAKEVVDA